ncbi:MAG TPA: gephyrin-like molybdotransferase Glp [Verrucomicrobiae bacterium]|nr:gephyrin-like molybdotransferase Glp [Verrucomicrobiae bacterium]
MLSFEAARAKVIEVVGGRESKPTATETIDLSHDPSGALGRILAAQIIADRNYPPFDRSIRDGFALRSADAAEPGARLHLVGESRAGVAFSGTMNAGECVRILTGAPVPRGANAVMMHEYTRSEGDFIVFEQAARAGQHFVLAGAEARVGEVLVPRGARLGYAELAVAAEVGHARVEVSRRPRVAILSTGDELVPLGEKPGPFQIRNSNNISLAAQVTLAGGEPVLEGSALDDVAELRARIERGLAADMLILSGGVSVGKYDLVEQVLQDLGAEVFFESLAIRPGKPAVFGWCRGKPVFGLPGNPVSTMVTFELLVAPAIELLCGHAPEPLPFFKAMLAHSVNEKGSVAHFLPARVSWPAGNSGDSPKVELVLWEGSGDIGAVARGNCFLVVYPSRPHVEAGEWVDVFPRRGSL